LIKVWIFQGDSLLSAFFLEPIPTPSPGEEIATTSLLVAQVFPGYLQKCPTVNSLLVVMLQLKVLKSFMKTIF